MKTPSIPAIDTWRGAVAPTDGVPERGRTRMLHTTGVIGAYVAIYIVLDFVSYIHPVAPYAITLPAMMLSAATKRAVRAGRSTIRPPESPFAR